MHYRPHIRIFSTRHPTFYFLIAVLCLGSLGSCTKKLKLKYGISDIKQVVVANLTPGAYLKVNISKSKQPDDFNPVEFLSNCKVDLYEDSIFKETMTYKLKDTLSGLGFYTSSFKLEPGKTYRIVSSHPELGIAEATEYLPPLPSLYDVFLYDHADSINTHTTGRYTITFRDSAEADNYYYISTFYQILKPVKDSTGDTTYVNDYIFNIPSYTSEFPNPSGYSRLFFTDQTFNGQVKKMEITFPSQYNNIYKEIYLIVELSNTGKNFYTWNVQQIPVGQNFLNDGQMERSNIKSNIINGYGHFTANSSVFTGIKVK